MANFGGRIVVLIDMDCFFCQVEAKLHPEYKGKPLAVVQYNQWKLGGIIAVNYEARGFGVTRHMRGEEAKEKCPNIILASVPSFREKSDTSRYRNAGREVIEVLKKHCNKIERASIDEAYLDITQIVENRIATNSISSIDLLGKLLNTYVVGNSESDENNEEQRKKSLQTWLNSSFEKMDNIQAQKFAIAGAIVEEIRFDVSETTGFKCSAGISYNKILAKLACGLHKPNKQTILPTNAVPILFKTLPVRKVRNLGGKLGDIVTDCLKCNVISDILRYSLHDLQNLFDEKTGYWLYNIARGIDNEQVTTKLVSKSIGVCKKYPGKQAIVNSNVLKHWLGELAAEVCERLEQDLEENERRATLLTVSFHYYQEKNVVSQSRSFSLNSYKPEKIATSCHNIITKSTQHPIAFLGLSAGKFVVAKGSCLFRNYFAASLKKTRNKVDSDFLEQKDSEIENSEKLKLIRNTKEIEYRTEVNPKAETVDLFQDYKLTSNNSFDRALNSDNFKQSFFMSILKDKHKNVTNKLMFESKALSFEENEKISETCVGNFNDICELKTKLKTADVDHDNVQNEDESFSNDLKSSDPSKFPLNGLDTISKKKETAAESEKNFEVTLSPFCTQVSSSNWTAAKMDDVEPFVNNKEKISIKVYEIFPDIGDIDPGVISLLKPELQKEAELLKNSTKINKKAEILAKHSKIKRNKFKSLDSGTYKGENSINSFLIKSTSICDSNDSFKNCDKCHQLVSVKKILEHNDYHIAQRMQKEMNKLISLDTQIKRKQSFDSNTETAKKRNTKTSKSDTKCKSIASFFL